jgi:hypothetical protein
MTDDGEREYRIALAGSLPGDQANGWDTAELKTQLDANRAKVRYALVAYNVLHTREVTDTGKRVLTIRLQAVEPVPDSDADGVRDHLQELYTERTGQASLFAMQDGLVATQDATEGREPEAGPWPGDPEWVAP